MDGRSLERRFVALRRRVMLIGGAAAVGWAVVILFVLAVVAAWFDLLWELSPQVRLGLDVLLVVAGLTAVSIGLWQAWSRTARHTLARRLDRTAGTGGQILSGYELSRSDWAEPADQPLTRGLAGIAVARAATLAEGIPPADVVPLRSVARVAAGLAAAGLAALGLIFFCPGLTATQSLRFADPFGDHPPYSRIAFHVEPGDVRVLYGGGLDVFVTTEGPPPERVELVLSADDSVREEVLPMFQGREGHWRTVLARVTSDARYYARARRSRSHQFKIDVITIPKLVDVRFRVVQPEYARRAVYQGVMPEGGIAGLAGTRVQVWAESNRPLSYGTLTTASGGEEQNVRLEPVEGSPTVVSGWFEIHSAGPLSVGITDVAGHEAREKFAGSIVLLPDEKPFIRMLQPPALAFATPEVTLPVVVSGEDDCGISSVQLFRSLNDSRALPMDFEVPRPSATRFDGQQTLPLSAYGLQPGDVIKLFARIEDNDPAGAKGAESSLVTVQIISQQDFERMQRMREGLEALASKYHQADRRLESLAADNEELRKAIEAVPDEELTDENRESLRQSSQRLREEAQEIRKSAKHLLPYDLDPALVDRLTELADSLEEAAAGLESENLQTQSRKGATKQLDELREKLAGDKQKFDTEATEPIEHLEKIYPLIEDQARFTALYQQQRDLAERLASLKGLDSNNTSQVKARMRTLEDEQNRLREEMNALLDDIETHATRLPDDEKLDDLRSTAQQFADLVRLSGAGEAMLECETGLASFTGTDAHVGAQKAADMLEQFLAKGKAMDGEGRACLKFQPGLEQALGNTIDQLLGEAGLGGSGPGSNGYSMRRSALNNVGLFGALPGVEERSGKGSGDGKPGRGAGQKLAGSHDDGSVITGQNLRTAAGTAAEGVPPRYRSRVGAYFQRIAEETPAE
jgi:hypothetical protein